MINEPRMINEPSQCLTITSRRSAEPANGQPISTPSQIMIWTGALCNFIHRLYVCNFVFISYLLLIRICKYGVSGFRCVRFHFRVFWETPLECLVGIVWGFGSEVRNVKILLHFFVFTEKMALLHCLLPLFNVSSQVILCILSSLTYH